MKPKKNPIEKMIDKAVYLSNKASKEHRVINEDGMFFGSHEDIIKHFKKATAAAPPPCAPNVLLPNTNTSPFSGSVPSL